MWARLDFIHEHLFCKQAGRLGIHPCFAAMNRRSSQVTVRFPYHEAFDPFPDPPRNPDSRRALEATTSRSFRCAVLTLDACNASLSRRGYVVIRTPSQVRFGLDDQFGHRDLLSLESTACQSSGSKNPWSHDEWWEWWWIQRRVHPPLCTSR